MAYTFEQIFAVDEANPSNIAKNGSVLIFAPGDTAKTPLTITTVDGQPLANPVTVNSAGFGPAFMHATLDRVAWEGGGFTGFFTSYDGMKNEAVAARTAAETAAADAATSAGLVNAPADTAVETLINGTGTATRAALNATYGTPKADKGGKTKTDGQNIKNLRRPTLVVDRMFPTPRADHEIVYVDETAKVAYSIGRDRRFRKATWTSITDMASTWGVVKATSPDNMVWAAAGVFFKESVTGNLFMYESDQSTGTDKLLRSTDDGTTWTSVLTMPGPNIKRCLGPQSVVQDEVTKYLYLAEYTTTVAATTADIWRSTDNGATWSVWKSMPRHDSNAGTIRHWHSARYDTVSQRVYFMAGDQNDIAGIYRVNSAGTDIEPVILNSHVPYNTFPGVGYAARAVDVMFFPDYIAWANDGGGGTVGQNYVYRMNRNQIGTAAPVVEQIAAIDNTGWYSQKASTDGTTWLCSTSTEIGGGPDADPYTAHLYAVTNNGAAVDEVSAVVMDGNEVGSASLTGFGNGGGAGNAFWLRAHNFAAAPTSRKTFSAFQLRARIAYGVAPLIKPPVADRLMYRNEGRNWAGALTAGETRIFGHCSVPQRTTKLVIRNYGAYTLVGTANTTRFEVYNATTGLIMLSTATLRDDRWTRDTDEFSTTLSCAAGDQILFRAVETSGTAGVTASVFVEFGFAFP